MLVFLWNVQNFKCKVPVLYSLILVLQVSLPVIIMSISYGILLPVLSKAILITTLH